MTTPTDRTVTILGVNGRIGQYAARAFAAAGWRVIGFGREDRVKIPGTEFIAGDANTAADIRRACEDAEVIVNALNLPYDKWHGGRYEAQMQAVLDGLKGSGKTMIYAGNIYNYAANAHLITPDTPQHPEKDKGEIRVRLERMLADASLAGDLQVLIVRAPDFYGPAITGSAFDLVMMRSIARGKLIYPGDPVLKHSWAYLPDLGSAYEKVASARHTLPRFESLLFRGHVVTGHEMIAAIRKAVSGKLRVSRLSWTFMAALGLFVPVVREVVKMSYLWRHPHEMRDEKLDTILGPGFGTPFEVAVEQTTRSFLPANMGTGSAGAVTA